LLEDHWTKLETPSGALVQPGADPDRFATLTVEPLERGFGLTLGNALRRVLLSSLRGAAVTRIQVRGARHEFSSLPGVREDVTDIAQNIKRTAIQMFKSGPVTLRLEETGPKEVLAGDIRPDDAEVKICNKDHPICQLDEGGRIHIDMEVETGKGYVPAASRVGGARSLTWQDLDAVFTPVRKVSFTVEKARVESDYSYDRLLLDVETDGTVRPADAVAIAAKIVQEQMQVFVNFDAERPAPKPMALKPLAEDERLHRRIEELGLSKRALNALLGENILYIGDLVQWTEAELKIRTPNVGGKSIAGIESALERMGLGLGMEVENWPPEHLEPLAGSE